MNLYKYINPGCILTVLFLWGTLTITGLILYLI